MPSRIPLVDLRSQHAEIAEEVTAGWAAVLDSMSFVLGDRVEQFEADFARYCGAPHCVGVGSGTDAIELALRACGIGRDDEVVLPAFTFAATGLAVLRVGARPRFLDLSDGSYLLDVDQAGDALRQGARAVIAVDLYGEMADHRELEAVAEQTGAVVIEDAAQSHGAVRDGRRAGSAGHAAATSFYPGKNLGAYGDAGAVLCRDDALALRVRQLRNYGGLEKYEHQVPGYNSRLDELQAVVLQAKLRRLDAWLRQRVEAAARYEQLLRGADAICTPPPIDSTHAWHLYVVRIPGRDDVVRAMRRRGIEVGVHYPMALHQLPVFAHLGYRAGDFPRAERCAEEVLSLPMHPHLRASSQEEVAEVLVETVRDRCRVAGLAGLGASGGGRP